MQRRFDVAWRGVAAPDGAPRKLKKTGKTSLAFFMMWYGMACNTPRAMVDVLVLPRCE